MAYDGSGNRFRTSHICFSDECNAEQFFMAIQGSRSDRRVESRGFQNLAGRVGSGRVESGRIESGRVGSGRVGSVRDGAASEKLPDP